MLLAAVMLIGWAGVLAASVSRPCGGGKRLATNETTKAVVAIDVSLSPAAGVGACGSPVNVGDARLALVPIAVCTNAVVAMDVSLSPAVGVGAFGSPVKVGDARSAFGLTAVLIAPVTNAVVAIDLSLSPAVAVGAVGLPVSAGEANGA